MPRFEDNILGLVPKQEWLDVGNNLVINRPGDPTDELIGDIHTDNLVAYWESLAAEYNIPLMAQFHGFDTEAQTTFRAPIDTHNVEKGLIKVKINQSERMRALLRSGVQNDDLYDYVINDGIRLADQVIMRSKVAKNELMATGKVTIKENNLDVTVDYGVPQAQTNLTLDFGPGASAPVDEQLEAIVSAALAKGVTINGIMLSRAMLNKLRKADVIQRAINGNAMAGVLVSNADLRAYLNEEYGIGDIKVNDSTYGVPGPVVNGRPTVVQKRLFPVDKVTFYGATNGKLGDGLWGDAPESDVAQLMDAKGSSESPFVTISQWVEKDPAVLWTKASALFMPALYNPNSLFIATAANTTEG